MEGVIDDTRVREQCQIDAWSILSQGVQVKAAMLIENSGVGDTSVVSPLQCFMPGSGLGVRVGGDLAAMWMFTAAGAQRMACIRIRYVIELAPATNQLGW